jgi:hypothetical protein
MTTAPLPQISAPAISRIISSNTNIRRAQGTGWSEGFTVVGYGTVVEVSYMDTNIGWQEQMLNRIADLINGREDRKYEAVKEQYEQGGSYVKVTVRRETEEDRMEKAAEESPYAVTKAEVNKVLAGPCYPYDVQSAGYVIERETGLNDRLVRVTYRDHSHTSYTTVEGGREAHVKNAVKHYAHRLRAAGFSVKVEGDYEYVVVGQPGEFPSEDDPQDVKDALNALREAVEAADTAYMTRKAGPTSLFVYYLVPFKDKVRRLEVFWGQGFYKVSGRFGGPFQEFRNMAHLLEHIRYELAD